MKRYKLFITMIACCHILFFASCDLFKLDNYDGPNATISGGIYDQETRELIQQDIINGMQIEYIEHGFDNPHTQYMIVKVDGTYRNDIMFANTYTIRPVRGNFTAVEEEEIVVKGNTIHDFYVQPYIRIKNAKIEKEGAKIVATFNIQQTVPNNVKRIGLFAHPETNVGYPINTVNSVQEINSSTIEGTQYRLEIDLNAHTDKLKIGKQYYFRVGALIDAGEAKYNYAPAVRITIE